MVTSNLLSLETRVTEILISELRYGIETWLSFDMVEQDVTKMVAYVVLECG